MDILIIFILILLNGFFALSEIAFVSSKKSKLAAEVHKGNRRAKLVLHSLKNPEQFLSSVQVCITLIGIVSGAFAGIALADDVGKYLSHIAVLKKYAYEISLIAVVFLVTYVSIVIGELLPKTIALQHPEKIIIKLIPVINVVTLIFYPVVILLSISTKFLLVLFRIRENDLSDNPVKEIVFLARLSVSKNKISKEQEKILLNTINISKIRIREIMLAMNDVMLLDTSMSLADALVFAHIYHHTRYPLKNSADGQIIGYVNFKDIVSALQINPQYNNLSSIAREILYLKENEKVIDSLQKMSENNQHIAIVKDSEGNSTGLITLEDLVETLIGDIEDEFDNLPTYVYALTADRFIVGGGATFEQLRRKTGLKTEIDQDITISKWFAMKSYLPPRPEMKLSDDGFTLITRKVKGSHVYEAILQLDGLNK